MLSVHFRDFQAIIDFVEIIGMNGLRTAKQLTFRALLHFDVALSDYKRIGMKLRELSRQVSAEIDEVKFLAQGSRAGLYRNSVPVYVTQFDPRIDVHLERVAEPLIQDLFIGSFNRFARDEYDVMQFRITSRRAPAQVYCEKLVPALIRFAHKCNR